MTPQELADRLIGTAENCNVHEELGEDIAILSAFDALAFECDGCGWWCGTDELNNDDGRDLCDQCNEEEG